MINGDVLPRRSSQACRTLNKNIHLLVVFSSLCHLAKLWSEAVQVYIISWITQALLIGSHLWPIGLFMEDRRIDDVTISIFFSFFFFSIRQIDSIAVDLFRYRSQKTSDSAASRLPFLCTYNILTSPVIYDETDARQHGISLLIAQHDWSVVTSVISTVRSLPFYQLLWVI